MHVERLEPGFDAPAAAAALHGRPGLVWLDGDGTGELGRFSFVASDPVDVRRMPFGGRELRAVLEDVPVPPPDAAPSTDADPRRPPPDRVPHWVGYVAYDAAWSMPWRSAPRHRRDAATPVVWLGRYDAVVAFDLADGCAWILGDDPSACARLRARLAETRPRPVRAQVGRPDVEASQAHAEAIRTAQAHIARGDIYQVNLARRWSVPFEGAPMALWRHMQRASPVPLGLFLDTGEHAVLARTMERFLRWERPAGRLTTRPIKGTIARSGADDGGEASTLRTDEKERAEHAMIVDLMRNDLGRVARTGSVEVRSPMTVEPYAGLSHLVSTVTCLTREDVTLADVIEATFPPGSVTGAPKERAIEIIEALEPSPRRIYTGCVGHVDRAGGVSLAVAIRTAVATGGRVEYHAGGGIVWPSIPEREVAETELKARAFLEAVEALRAEPGDAS